jgi:hypothetical protein
MLAPLTGLARPIVKYKRGDQKKEFDEIEQKRSQENLLAFPDFEK